MLEIGDGVIYYAQVQQAYSTNSQVPLQKWFDPIVQGTSTGSRGSRSVNFSKELRKAFQ